MNAPSIALGALFAALAIALNTVRIPSIYWPNFYYTFCDIPVLVAFMIFGFKIGFLVEGVHILGQEIFFPVGAAGVVAYPMGFFVHLLMFSGIYSASKFLSSRALSGKHFGEKSRILYSTGFAAAFRGAIMPILDYAFLYHVLLPIAVGTAIPETYIMPLVPSFVIYNMTSALYAVPIAYIAAARASKYLEIETSIPMPT